MDAALQAHFSPRLRTGEPMARHTSWRVGGPAQAYFEPRDLADVQALFGQWPGTGSGAPGDGIHWIGLGSNLLVRDGGIPGLVIASGKAFGEFERTDSAAVRCGAGLACAQLARRSAREGLSGAEFFCGIPGTLGGALAMNAGAFGGETWEVIEAVETIDRAGEVRRRPAADYRHGYRELHGPQGEWFVAAHLRLQPGSARAGAARIRELLARRAATQPIGQPNAGSVFRNPPGDHAARLIEASGLKGHRIGQAEISTVHANFIVNLGGARASDIEALMQLAMDRVHAGFGVRLEPEVRVLGVPA